MLNDRNILCISNTMWEGDYAKTIVELMGLFALQNKVLYVDNPYTFKDIVQGVVKRRKLNYKEALGLTDRVRKISLEHGGVIYILTTPIIFPINFLPKGGLYSFMLKMNGWVVTRAIKKALARLNMNDRLINIVAFNPALGVACARKFNEDVLIYHCYDEINAATWLKKHGGWLEEKFMKVVDMSVFTSKGLYEKKKALSPKGFLVKNAVNFGLFNKGANLSPATDSRKVVGYIGSIDNRLNYELLVHLVTSLPDMEFVFVGRAVAQEEAKLKGYANVTFTGPKTVKELPGYLSRFSIGIIPFVKNEFTKGIYPLKINEYLAAGVPVISTDFSYLDDFEDVISIGSSKEEFRNKLVEEVVSDNIEKKHKRIQTARHNSWEHRVDQISEIINDFENNKKIK